MSWVDILAGLGEPCMGGMLMLSNRAIDGLLKRDPRMVERKKTGLAKARKRVRPTQTSL